MFGEVAQSKSLFATIKKDLRIKEMAINIKNVEADKLVRELSELTGETITETVIRSLTERLEREKSKQAGLLEVKPEEELLAIAKRYHAIPSLDERPEEEILGYNDGY